MLKVTKSVEVTLLNSDWMIVRNLAEKENKKLDDYISDIVEKEILGLILEDEKE